MSQPPSRPRTGASPGFDRVRAPGGARRRHRDGLGTEALYTTAPTAAPASQVELRCRRCEVPFGLSVLGTVRLLVPPFVYDPVRRRLWTRCPVCDRRAWLEVRAGAPLRLLLDR